MAGKRAAVGAGEPVDLSSYAGEDASGEFSQPFWDVELYRADADPNDLAPEDPIGQDGPAFAPGVWDRLQLGDYVLPGLWRINGSIGLQMDVQKPMGYDGAAIITRGYVPGSISMMGTIWTPAQWARYQEIYPAIWTRPFKVSAQDVVLGKNRRVGTIETDTGLIVGKQRALTITHPAVNQVGITAVVLSRIYLPVPGPIFGTMTVQFDAMEYVAEPGKKPPAQKRISGQKSRGQGAIERAIAEKGEAKAPSANHAALEPGKLKTEL